MEDAVRCQERLCVDSWRLVDGAPVALAASPQPAAAGASAAQMAEAFEDMWWVGWPERCVVLLTMHQFEAPVLQIPAVARRQQRGPISISIAPQVRVPGRAGGQGRRRGAPVLRHHGQGARRPGGRLRRCVRGAGLCQHAAPLAA